VHLALTVGCEGIHLALDLTRAMSCAVLTEDCDKTFLFAALRSVVFVTPDWAAGWFPCRGPKRIRQRTAHSERAERAVLLPHHCRPARQDLYAGVQPRGSAMLSRGEECSAGVESMLRILLSVRF